MEFFYSLRGHTFFISKKSMQKRRQKPMVFGNPWRGFAAVFISGTVATRIDTMLIVVGNLTPVFSLLLPQHGSIIGDGSPTGYKFEVRVKSGNAGSATTENVSG